MENSKIGWTDHTMNFWWGCNRVSPACKHCYIGPIMKRSGNVPFQGAKRTSAATWRKAHTWHRDAARQGRRYRVFTCSMSDFFHAKADGWRNDAWEVIRECSNLDWLILTKRPQRITRCLPKDWNQGWPHVWLGVTVESQAWTQRLDSLVTNPAVIRFVSAEPLLGLLNLRPWLSRVDWVITGCERAGRDSRREMKLDWVRDIRDQCDDCGVPLFHKQYYAGTELRFDGVIDGIVRQEWPTGPLHLPWQD